MCVPGSHVYASRFWADFEKRGKNPNHDFLMFEPDDSGLRAAVQEHGWVRVCPKPGQVLVWSSRLVHSNGAGRPRSLSDMSEAQRRAQRSDPLLRLVGYVSCSAVCDASEEAKTLEWYTEQLRTGKMYNHHTTPGHMKAEHLRYPRHASYLPLRENGAALPVEERERRFLKVYKTRDEIRYEPAQPAWLAKAARRIAARTFSLDEEHDRDPDEWSGEEGDYASGDEALDSESESDSDSFKEPSDPEDSDEYSEAEVDAEVD
jgi:hypothetical protein